MATRLMAQKALLVYADPDNPGGPDLGNSICGIIRIAPDFDCSALPSTMQHVYKIFPPPLTDDFYRVLLELPASVRLNPKRLELPLTIPCYLSADPSSQESGVVRVEGGTGERSSPMRLTICRLPSVSAPHPIMDLLMYLDLTRSLKPPLFHAFLLTKPEDSQKLELAGKTFFFKDAMPFLLETPIWFITPPVDNERGRRAWIQSALPLGIAEEIAGKPTDNVYLEMSPLDNFPGTLFPTGDLHRGVWVVRTNLEYAVTIFAQGQGAMGFNSITIRFRYDSVHGLFESPTFKGAGDDAQEYFNGALKALFVTLMLLHDLSPGFKPPPLHAAGVGDWYYPATLLEPQLGIVQHVEGTEYLVPKAMNGTAYARWSGVLKGMQPEPADPSEKLAILERYFSHIRDPYYITVAGASLAEMNAYWGKFDRALDTVRKALEAAQSVGLTPSIPDLRDLEGKILSLKGDPASAQKAFEFASNLRQELQQQEGAVSVQEVTVSEGTSSVAGTPVDLETPQQSVERLLRTLTESASNQRYTAMRQAFQTLQDLADRFPDDHQVQLSLAKASTNIVSFYGTYKWWTMMKFGLFTLEELGNKYSNDTEIQVKFAEGCVTALTLYGMSAQLLIFPAISEVLKMLKDLATRYPECAKIQDHFAAGLVSSIACSVQASRQKEVMRLLKDLEDLAQHFPAYEAIQIQLAHGYFNAMVYYGTQKEWAELERTMQRLQELSQCFHQNIEIQLALASGARNAIGYYGLECQWEEMQRAFAVLKDIGAKFQDDARIQQELAEGLFNALDNYGTNQRWAEMFDAFETLKVLADRFRVNVQMQTILAQGLFSALSFTGNHHRWTEMRDLFQTLQVLVGRSPHLNEEIPLELARATDNALLSCCEGKRWDDLRQAYQILKKLGGQYPGHHDIQLILAMGACRAVIAYGTNHDWENMQQAFKTLNDVVARHSYSEKMHEVLRSAENFLRKQRGR